MTHRAGLVTLGCAIWFCSVQTTLGQRHGIPIQVDYERPAGTWQESAARSQVTVVVRLTGRRQGNRPVNPGQFPTTVYEAQVLEVLRNAGAFPVPPVIEIQRIGGLIDKPEGSVIVQEAGFPPWFVGTKLLLFLTWNDDATMLVPVGGPNAAFEADQEGKVRTFGKGALAARQNRRTFSELVSEIREALR